ncbi:Protein SRG1 [Zea mays]|uniref:Protein SRG1 n=2 Tax=Zea mays TaxID=4577 RepID=A0A1D6K3M9_MAIZE|nr:Protein SRG1 [Zea mays]
MTTGATSRLLDPESSEEETAKLASACLDWGFFQLINHGIPDEVTGNLMNDVAGFFGQPLDAKKECAQQADSLEGYGQAFVVSEDQKLDWADMLFLIVQPREARDTRFWPTRPASFGDSVDSYSLEASRLAYRLLELMARGVGAADPASLRRVFEGQTQGMRVNYYPPCRRAADRVLGLSPHTDASGLTLLLQASNGVQGLQVRKDGRWFAVDAIDGALVVNVGDFLEILSNGKFTSVEHRAVVHPTRERMSAALFLYPRQNMRVGPLPEFVNGGNERYGSTDYEEFMKHYFATKLDGRKHLDRLKLEQ